jgi:hypothetical protein
MGYPASSRASTIFGTSVFVLSKVTQAVAFFLSISTFTTPSTDLRTEPILSTTAGQELHAGTLRTTVFSVAMAWLAALNNNTRLNSTIYTTIFFRLMGFLLNIIFKKPHSFPLFETLF